MTRKTIKIAPLTGTGFAESKDDARDIRRDVLLPALEADQRVEIDFADVDVATQSFIHALISEAIWRYGDDSFELLRFTNCSDDVREVILTVFDYTLAASEASKTGDATA